MTNDDIDEAAVKSVLFWLEATDGPCESAEVQLIAKTIRRFVSQAYEEAARTLELMALDCEAREREWRANPLHVRPSARGACLSGASEIRALKDSLVKEEVSA